MPHAKTVLFYTENYLRGGAIRYLLDFVEAAGQTGARVYVASNRNGIFEENIQELSGLRVDYFSVSILSWAELRYGVALMENLAFKIVARVLHNLLLPLVWAYQYFVFVRLLKRLRPDLVVGANGGYPGGGSVLRLLTVCGFMRTPCLLSAVSMPSTLARDRRRLKLWDRWIPKVVEATVVCAEQIKMAFVKEHRFANEDIQVIYNGLRDRAFKSKPLRSRPKVLFLSRIEAAKGVLIFLEALKQLPDLPADVIFVGNGPQLSDVEKFAAHSKSVQVFGHWSSATADFFDDADIFVFPSFHEGFPYAILEAMRSGCAVIATRVGGIPEAIEDSVTGLLIAPNDVEALKKALDFLVTDPALRTRLGQNALARFLKRFRHQTTNDRFKAILESGLR